MLSRDVIHTKNQITSYTTFVQLSLVSVL
jgi:hypothetical protein